MNNAVIFLDFDGPIIPTKSWVLGHFDKTEKFDPIAVETIKLALRLSKAKLVISSSWRIYSRDLIVKILDDNGIKEDLLHIDWKIDSPPTCKIQDRSYGINRWLTSHPEIVKYAVLDDLKLNVKFLVHIDSDNGFSKQNQIELFKFLNITKEIDKEYKVYQELKMSKRHTVYHMIGNK